MAGRLDQIWAKSPVGSQSPVTLISHTKAVVRRLLQLRNRYPSLPNLVNNPLLWSHAFWACWLHDFGKSAHGFQAMLRGGPAWSHRHEILSLGFAAHIFPNPVDLQWITVGIASHHKDWRFLRERYPERSPEDWDAEELIRQIAPGDWMTLLHWAVERGSATLQYIGLPNLAIRPLPSELPPLSTIRVEITRTLANYYRQARTVPARSRDAAMGIVMRGLVTQADHLASAHAPALEEFRLPEPSGWFCPDGGPYDHQYAAGRHAGSLLLSAPTGSGKTEAALLWGRCQQQSGGGGIVYLLPYQASLNAMGERLETSLNRSIAVVHARSLQAIYQTLLEGGETPANAEQKARAANSLAHLNVPGIRLTTPFQLLKGAYRLRGYEALWTNLTHSLLIVDEIHAYEPVRLGMMIGMLRELHSRWGARICVMTATLPSWLCGVIEDALGVGLLKARPDFYKKFSRHRIETLPGGFFDRRWLTQIVTEVEAGNKVLLVANTVATAQRLYQWFSSVIPKERRILLHSRFTAGDRTRQELKLRGQSQADGGFLAIGTQTVEVSLDLDFDRLWSEPAPLEALIQRFGRVNRRGRKSIAPVRVLQDSEHDGKVYDPELKRRSFDLLATHNGEMIDEAALSNWIDQVYSSDFGPEYARLAGQAIKEFDASCLGRLVPFDSDRQMEKVFTRLFDGDEAVPEQFCGEYARLIKKAPLEARQLLLPMRQTSLTRAATWDEDLDVWVANRPYDPEFGLQLYRAPMDINAEEESA